MSDVDDIDLNALTPAEREALALDDNGEPPAPAADAYDAEYELREDIEPLLKADMPANGAEIESRIDAEEVRLSKLFDEGDITSDEYRQAQRELNSHREELNWRRRKAELARDMSSQAETAAWNAEVARFMTTTGADIAKSMTRMKAFDNIVRDVTSDPARKNLTDRAQLALAYKLYQQEFGSGSPAGRRDDSMSTASAPGSMGSGSANAVSFDKIDKLAESDPRAYERAVAKMSPEEFDRFANR